MVRNKNAKPADYGFQTDTWRPSHADYTYEQKYGVPLTSGGGRASARETISRVFAGVVAKQMMNHYTKTESSAYTCSVGDVSIKEDHQRMLANQSLEWFSSDKIASSIVRCPYQPAADSMLSTIESAKKSGDSLGGQIVVRFRGVPVGLGEPVFDKLESLLAKAMLSLPAVKGFEIGSGFSGTMLDGSVHNDVLRSSSPSESANFASNYSGGVQGGISNGAEIYFFVAFKPTSTIQKPQKTADKKGGPVVLKPGGRHDPCVVPRAVVICEAMAWHVLADLYLRQKTQQR